MRHISGDQSGVSSSLSSASRLDNPHITVQREFSISFAFLSFPMHLFLRTLHGRLCLIANSILIIISPLLHLISSHLVYKPPPSPLCTRLQSGVAILVNAHHWEFLRGAFHSKISVVQRPAARRQWRFPCPPPVGVLAYYFLDIFRNKMNGKLKLSPSQSQESLRQQSNKQNFVSKLK